MFFFFFFFFFLQQTSQKATFTLPVVNDNEIMRSTSDVVERKSGVWCAIFEAVGANVFCNFWLSLTMSRNKNGIGWPPQTMRNSSVVVWTCDEAQQKDFIFKIELVKVGLSFLQSPGQEQSPQPKALVNSNVTGLMR